MKTRLRRFINVPVIIGGDQPVPITTSTNVVASDSDSFLCDNIVLTAGYYKVYVDEDVSDSDGNTFTAFS